MQRKLHKAIIAALLLAAVPAAQAADDSGWHGRLEMPLWIYASTGRAVVGGHEVDVDTSFSDAIDGMSSLTGAFSGVVEVGKGRWRGFFGGTYMELQDDTEVANTTLRANTEISMWDIGLGWRVRGDADGEDGYLDLIGGMRSFDTDIKVTNLNTEAETKVGKERSHGFIGLKGGHPLGERWMLEYRADAGGFSSTNMSFQGYLGARRSWDNGVYLSMGYRLLDIDYTAAGGDGYTYDALQHGPAFAFGWKF